MSKNISDVHYWQMPEGLFVSLKAGFHQRLCLEIQEKLRDKHKNCFYKILNCPKWHAQRLFTHFNRMTLNELETLREFAGVNKDETEREIESLGSHEDGTIITNVRLPFNLNDLVYVASHLMFDGSYRDKKGCYFYAYEPSLVEYHKKRLSKFGKVPVNFIEGENQLYFSYTIGYVASKVLEIDNFKSTKTCLSEKLKKLAKENKLIADEIIKALIIDEGNIEDKLGAELANEKLVRDICEVVGIYYKLNKITSRTRTIEFKNKPEWTRTVTVWSISFCASGFSSLYRSLSPIPIYYKQDNLKFLFDRQNRGFNQRRMGETRKLIVKSLLKSPKSMDELAKELLIKQTTIRAHLKGHLRYKDSLMSLGIIDKIDEKLLRRGGFARVGIYGIKDVEMANEFIKMK